MPAACRPRRWRKSRKPRSPNGPRWSRTPARKSITERRSDHAAIAQARDVGVLLSQQLAQNLGGMLPEDGWRRLVLDRRPREAHRARHHGQPPGGGVLELDAHAARLDLRLLEHLRDVVD